MAWYNLIKYAENINLKDQKGFQEYFGDIQRYGVDAYDCRVYVTRTEDKITVSLTLTCSMQGLVMYQKFWKYDLNEWEKAKKTFEEVKKAAKKVLNDFRTNETPNPLLWTYIKDAIHDIDQEHLPQSNIPWGTYIKDIRSEKDVRSQLYGTRYPKNTNGF
jgi:hypothetical protein